MLPCNCDRSAHVLEGHTIDGIGRNVEGLNADRAPTASDRHSEGA